MLSTKMATTTFLFSIILEVFPRTLRQEKKYIYMYQKEANILLCTENIAVHIETPS